MSDLVTSIAELQAEFQHIADVHPWVCLFRRTATHDNGGPAFVGRPVGPVGFRDALNPLPPVARPVLDRVNLLTLRASALVQRLLEEASVFPPDVAEEIRDWEERCWGDGWVRVLWYAAIPWHVYWIENYPQVAANALAWLKDAAARPQSPNGRNAASLGDKGADTETGPACIVASPESRTTEAGVSATAGQPLPCEPYPVTVANHEQLAASIAAKMAPPANETTAASAASSAKGTMMKSQDTAGDPATPRDYLIGWPDILAALNRKSDDKEPVRRLNEQFKGPIKIPGRGSRPMVDRAELIDWWNSLKTRHAAMGDEEALREQDREATLANQYRHGKEGHADTEAPGISGRVKHRRTS
jgi:hypothetical protein